MKRLILMIFAGLNLAFAGVTEGQSELELEAATKRAAGKKPPVQAQARHLEFCF
ncbi:MAG: hypothetical protein ACTTJF_01945 [Campylobacter sp.]|uniref:hypothetical protein n=1 Tax=Campylobacter sp. TaxID=205 RepID=UPI003FA18AA4